MAEDCNKKIGDIMNELEALSFLCRTASRHTLTENVPESFFDGMSTKLQRYADELSYFPSFPDAPENDDGAITKEQPPENEVDISEIGYRLIAVERLLREYGTRKDVPELEGCASILSDAARDLFELAPNIYEFGNSPKLK